MPEIRSLTSDICCQTWYQTLYISHIRRLASDIRHLTSQCDIRLTTETRHLRSDVWHQTCDIRHVTSDVWDQTYHTSDIWHQTHGTHQTSYIYHTSDIWYQTSDIRRVTSDFWHRMSHVRHLKSDVWHQTPDVWNQACDILRPLKAWLSN